MSSTLDNHDAFTPELFYSACARGEYDKLKRWLDLGISPNFFYITFTPLIAALINKLYDITDLLISYGAAVNYREDLESFLEATPLTYACNSNCTESVQYLLNREADVNLGCSLYGTPLSAAVRAGNTELIQLLLDAGALIDKRYDYLTDNPLETAVKANNRKIAHFLISKGAKTKILSKIERHKIPVGMVKFLKEKGYL